MNLLLPDSGLLFWMTIIFLIVFALLAKFGFPMITGMVEKRTKRIDEALAAAREAESRLSNLAQHQEAIIEETRREQARLMQEAAAQREEMMARSREQASAEAKKIIEEAKERIARERDEAICEIRSEVAKISLSIAEKVVRKDLESDKGQRELVDKLTREMSALDPDARS